MLCTHVIPSPIAQNPIPILISDRIYSVIQGDRESEYMFWMASTVRKLRTNMYLSDFERSLRVGIRVIRIRISLVTLDDEIAYLISDTKE